MEEEGGGHHLRSRGGRWSCCNGGRRSCCGVACCLRASGEKGTEPCIFACSGGLDSAKGKVVHPSSILAEIDKKLRTKRIVAL